MKKEKSNKNKDIRPGYWRKAENERIYAQDEVYISDSDSGEMVLAPQMFWPVYEFEYEKFSYEEKYRLLIKDQDFFPKFDEYCQSINCVRNFSENMNPENIYIRTSFLDSLCKAEIVYIVDKFFSETEYDFIMSYIRTVRDYKLRKLWVIGKGNESRNLYNRVERKERKPEEKNINVEVQVANMEVAGDYYFDIHDRFAVLDDEIWHFGGTICGIGHSLTAYSRGWRDVNRNFRDYLDKMVKQCRGD